MAPAPAVVRLFSPEGRQVVLEKDTQHGYGTRDRRVAAQLFDSAIGKAPREWTGIYGRRYRVIDSTYHPDGFFSFTFD